MKRVPWNKGKRGLQEAWNKGLTKETDERVKKYAEKLPQARKGIILSKKHKESIRKSLKGRVPWNVGIKTTEKVKQKIRGSTSGGKNHFYGKTHTRNSKKQISKSRKGKCKGIKNSNCKIDLNIHKKEIINEYLNKNSAKTISQKYRVTSVTVLNYLNEWNVKKRKSFYGQGFINCKDGHKVLSYPELFIDNFLHFNGIKHETNNKILDTKFKYDFYIPEIDLYIEYWGLENSETYSQRKSRKLEIYKKRKLKLLSITPKDNISKKLGFLIPLCSKKQNTLKTNLFSFSQKYG